MKNMSGNYHAHASNRVQIWITDRDIAEKVSKTCWGHWCLWCSVEGIATVLCPWSWRTLLIRRSIRWNVELGRRSRLDVVAGQRRKKAQIDKEGIRIIVSQIRRGLGGHTVKHGKSQVKSSSGSQSGKTYCTSLRTANADNPLRLRRTVQHGRLQ